MSESVARAALAGAKLRQPARTPASGSSLQSGREATGWNFRERSRTTPYFSSQPRKTFHLRRTRCPRRRQGRDSQLGEFLCPDFLWSCRAPAPQVRKLSFRSGSFDWLNARPIVQRPSRIGERIIGKTMENPKVFWNKFVKLVFAWAFVLPCSAQQTIMTRAVHSSIKAGGNNLSSSD